MPVRDRTDATDRTRAATALAGVLGFDALLHLYWATGSTWPANNEKALSYAVLGVEAPFSPPVVLPLATLLLCASGIVLAGARRRHRLLRLGTLAVAAGLSLRAVAGVYWLITKDTGSAFYWLNLVLYTPLCVLLGAAALRVNRWEDAVRVR